MNEDIHTNILLLCNNHENFQVENLRLFVTTMIERSVTLQNCELCTRIQNQL